MATPVPTHPQETLRRAQRVEIVALRQVNDAMVGAYLSRFKGRGTDFEELREYVPGDDVRAMDWNVTARTGKPFIRLHREERELTLVLAVDVSGSAGFGSGEQTLRERAADVAACLAVSALKAGDKVGLLLFTDREELWVAPRKGRRHVLRIIREVLEFRPVSRRTSFVQPMRRLGRALRRRSMVFVVSDFLAGPEGGDAMAAALAELNSRHDTACVQIVDERERILPDVGVVALEDAETGEIREVDTSSFAVRQAFAAQAEARLTETAALLGRAGTDVARLEAGIIKHLGFKTTLNAVGQVYPRSLDFEVVSALHQVGAAAASFATTLRLMAGQGLLTEGFQKGQVGSSAMPHKVNARNCERICGFSTILSGYVTMTGAPSGHQWNEGDVSCSVVRRVALPDAFYAIDGLLETLLAVLNQMDVFEAAIAAEIQRQLPFLATTTILMEAVKAGVGRETAHLAIKENALAAAKSIRTGQGESDLVVLLAADVRLGLSEKSLRAILSDAKRFIGAAPQQVDTFVATVKSATRKLKAAAAYEPGKLL